MEGGGALDFTSALYLGMRHPAAALRPWSRLTSGVPAALGPPPGAARAARSLAALQGCPAGLLAPSTLHLFWDLFAATAGRDAAIHLDAGAYPVARWGAERLRARGVPIRRFAHHDPDALRRAVGRGGGRPIVVADGFCPGCGRPAPLGAFLDVARDHGGTLVIDDTQAIGILGAGPDAAAPYGRGGGGSLRHQGIAGSDVVAASSLAKGFGVPAAVLAGGRAPLGRFAATAGTRVHCSPPSAADAAAAEHALALNRAAGERLRTRLVRRVRRLRAGLAGAEIGTVGGDFPVQALRPPPGVDAAGLHRRLADGGLRAVLQAEGCRGGGPRVTLIVNATHGVEEIDRAVRLTARAVLALRRRRRSCNASTRPATPAG